MTGDQPTLRDQLADALPHLSGCLALLPPASTTIASTGPCICRDRRRLIVDALMPLIEADRERRP